MEDKLILEGGSGAAYEGNILLVGINCDMESKSHECAIEEYHCPFMENVVY